MDDVLNWSKTIFEFSRNQDRKNTDAFKADEHIYYCKSCNRCWEKSKQTTKNHIEFYEDFVTYGKERKICKYCTPDANV
jgi:hypothetical protein